jgi:hypothetical protein
MTDAVSFQNGNVFHPDGLPEKTSLYVFIVRNFKSYIVLNFRDDTSLKTNSI